MNFRQALRSLIRTPIFAIAVILSLVLGIAAAGSMFAVMHGVLLAPLPYGAPDRLVSVALQDPAQRRMQQPPALHALYSQYAKQVAEVGFYRTGNANILSAGEAGAERVTATWVTPSLLPLLRVPLLFGRSFTNEEARRGGSEAVILSESFWRARFNSADDVIGKTIVVNSVERQVVGVMPARFAFPTAGTSVYLPAKPNSLTSVGEFSYSGVARLAEGATVGQAQRELAAILPRLPESYPRLESGGATSAWLAELNPTPVLLPLQEEVTGAVKSGLLLLAAASGLVLLIAWANVINLMLMRADALKLELAARAALGASRLRIASHFLGESLLLGTFAGALSLFAVYFALRGLLAFGPDDMPRLSELSLSPVSMGFTMLISLLSVLICAAAPILLMPRSLNLSLADGARGKSVSKAHQRLRSGFTVLQIALALVVSMASMLLLRTAHNLHAVHPGFDASNVTTVWTQLPFARYDNAAAVAFYARLREQASQLPGVLAAGLTMRVPLIPGENLQQNFQLGAGKSQTLPVNVVDNGYFEALKIPLIAGRGFQAIESEHGSNLVISLRAALSLFGDASGAAAVGKRLASASGLNYTVIGVVGDVREQRLDAAPVATIYRPQVVPVDAKQELGARRTMALLLRTSDSTGATLLAVRQIVQALDREVPIFNVETMENSMRASTARLSITITLMTAAAFISLLLGAVGLYGVMAYMVQLRTREFGVRVALGADPRRIARLVAVRALWLCASGLASGILLYALAAPFLRVFLYGVSEFDPAMLIAAMLTLLVTAALASWLPAMRAARIDPVEAMRAE